MGVSNVRKDRPLQRDIFLQSEADAWFERNREACDKHDYSTDPISRVVQEIASASEAGQPLTILEIGCGGGGRLAWLAQRTGAEVHGVEPSAKAVTEAARCGVMAIRATADVLPYDDGVFDILIFGFCLYLCDPEDLFRIAEEADRVLKSSAWLVIHDFYMSAPTRRAYHHKPGLYSHKMDFRRLFDWHPGYTCYSHRVVHHVTRELCDDQQEWVATSVLRKKNKVG